jgi:hypothetical protein
MGRWDTHEEPAPCPRCGGPSVCLVSDDPPHRRGGGWYCDACLAAIAALRADFERQWGERFGLAHPRIRRALCKHFAPNGGFAALLRASDRELLEVTMIGPTSLTTFRSLWPQPRAVPSPTTDGAFWAQHAVPLWWVGG